MVDTGKKHINRRDFIRIAGLAATSIAAGNIFSPLDKTVFVNPSVEAADNGGGGRPWWVRTVAEPTTEVDWARMHRFDARTTMRGQGFIDYVGQAEVDRLNSIKIENEKQRILGAMPGYTLKDHALNAAQSNSSWTVRSFLGPGNVQTPMDRAVPRWTGTPATATRILRQAMRHFGAATIGFIELNERTKKLIYSYDPDGKEIVFEDVDQASETDNQRVIPTAAKWVIVYTVQMSAESIKRAPTILAEQTTKLSYSRGLEIQNKTQEFLRGLGYQCLGEASSNALGISPALAVMAGLGELSRQNRVITPEFGPMVRIFKLITDLPVEPDQPIDAGIMAFCRSCKKCAESCPASALSFEDDPSWETKGKWNNPGHKAYFEDSIKCRVFQRESAGSNCGICFAVCPFAKKNKAWIHDWVKASISTLPISNGFLRSLDDALSYGAQKDPEFWWHLNLPEYGIDTEQATRDAS
jgi:epoxyqueuosine reductase